MTVATPSDPPEMHQWNAAATTSYDFLEPFNDYLTRTDPVTCAVVPWIAESWEVSADKLSYVVHLTEGVKFHDGVELTAEDVKWNFDFIMENNFTRMSSVWQILSREKPTEIINDYTLRFYLTQPYVSFPSKTLGNPYIYPKHIWEEIVAKPEFDWLTYVPTLDELVGCGPFKLIEYVSGIHYRFEAFDDYWHGRPYVDDFLRPIITSGDAELQALKRGEIDIFTGFLASEAIPGLLREEDIGLYLYNNPYMYHWGMNNYKWPLNVKEFRFALAHAIDKQHIVDKLLLGYGLPGTHGVEAPFFSYWFNPNVPETYYFDLDKAAEILDDLGWVDTDGDGVREGTGEHAGEPLAFDIGPPIYDPVRCRAAELLSEWFSTIGVNATVQYMEWATLWGRITQPLDSPTKIDTWLLGSSQSVDPSWMHTRLHSDNIPNPNYYGFVNAEYDELAMLQGTQFDNSERQASIWRMQEILAEEVPFVVLYFRQSPSAYRTDNLTGWIKNFGSGMNHFWNYINVYIQEGGHPIPPEPPEITWDLDLSIEVGAFEDDLKLGTAPDATYGFDTEYDAVSPPPPPLGLYTYFWYPNNPRSPVDLRNLSTSIQPLDPPTEWSLKVQTEGESGQAYMRWSKSTTDAIPENYKITLYTESDSIDMRSESEYTWFADGDVTYSFTISITSEVTITLELKSGWNMISLPVKPEDASAEIVLGDIGFYELVTWSKSGYVTAITFDPGMGYMLFVLEDVNVQVTGLQISQVDITLKAGWNMIGGPNKVVYADDVFHGFYQLMTWDGKGHTAASSFEPGRGYWVLTLDKTEINIS